MGSLHNADTIVNVNKMEWQEKAFQSAKDNSCMTLLSFHDSTGASINDCIDPTTGHLKPVRNGAVADCRPNGIKFCKVNVKVDYSSLDKKNKPNISFTTFLQLEMKDVTVANTSGTNRTMNTYTGISDFLSDTIENFTTNIYGNAEAITKPFDLKEEVSLM